MSTATQKTPLNHWHRQNGAKMVEFGGWEMPIEYSGIIQEHSAVRGSAGLFDISHMGELRIDGPEALPLVQWITCNDTSKLKIGQIQYSAFLTPQGTFVDDILVYRLSENSFFICVNAANTSKDFEWVRNQNHFQASASDVSHEYAQLSLQGPRSIEILQPLVDSDLSQIRYYWFTWGNFRGIPAMISRTGYTGEDGFELYLPPDAAEDAWKTLVTAGKPLGLMPVGLGARNTLRLEAKMALYGHEISDKITPWEADLNWIVKMGKGDFVGRNALEKQAATGVQRKLAGFEMTGRGIARDGYKVWLNGIESGWVTSGSPSPSLGKNIGLAYLPIEHCSLDEQIEIQVRTNRVPAKIVATPFYKRK
jgi:aminomethyltransferase